VEQILGIPVLAVLPDMRLDFGAPPPMPAAGLPTAPAGAPEEFIIE
jgi:hypothetical protein